MGQETSIGETSRIFQRAFTTFWEKNARSPTVSKYINMQHNEVSAPPYPPTAPFLLQTKERVSKMDGHSLMFP